MTLFSQQIDSLRLGFGFQYMGCQISFLHQEQDPFIPIRTFSFPVTFLIQMTLVLDTLVDMLDSVDDAALGSVVVG